MFLSYSPFEKEIINCILNIPDVDPKGLTDQFRTATVCRNRSAANYSMMLRRKKSLAAESSVNAAIIHKTIEIVIDPNRSFTSYNKAEEKNKRQFSPESVCICVYFDEDNCLCEVEVYSIAGNMLNIRHLPNGQITYWMHS